MLGYMHIYLHIPAHIHTYAIIHPSYIYTVTFMHTYMDMYIILPYVHTYTHIHTTLHAQSYTYTLIHIVMHASKHSWSRLCPALWPQSVLFLHRMPTSLLFQTWAFLMAKYVLQSYIPGRTQHKVRWCSKSKNMAGPSFSCLGASVQQILINKSSCSKPCWGGLGSAHKGNKRNTLGQFRSPHGYRGCLSVGPGCLLFCKLSSPPGNRCQISEARPRNMVTNNVIPICVQQWQTS